MTKQRLKMGVAALVIISAVVIGAMGCALYVGDFDGAINAPTPTPTPVRPTPRPTPTPNPTP